MLGATFLSWHLPEWVATSCSVSSPDEPDPMQRIPAPIKVVEYDDPVIRYYGINFCEGDNASAVWFSASSALQYYGNTYQYNRRILSGVCVLDE